MRFNRREFIRLCVSSGAALGLSGTVIGRLEKALAAGGEGLPTVIWLNGANCTGCTVSLANRISEDAPVDVADLFLNTVNLAFHPNLMGAAGDLAVEQIRNASLGAYVLVADGGIPTAFGGYACMVWTEDGREVTALEAVRSLAPGASAILSVGTCSSFGGIPAASPNPTAVLSLSEAAGMPAIRIPGCPPHPDWVVWTLAQLLAGVDLRLDDFGRPAELYGDAVHKKCPRKGTPPAERFGVDGGCLKELGCQGPKTRADCPVRLWNNKTSWCVQANAVCIGCTEKGFPGSFLPFYKEKG